MNNKIMRSYRLDSKVVELIRYISLSTDETKTALLSRLILQEAERFTKKNKSKGAGHWYRKLFAVNIRKLIKALSVEKFNV